MKLSKHKARVKRNEMENRERSKGETIMLKAFRNTDLKYIPQRYRRETITVQ